MRRNKFGAKKTVIDGVTFDSKKEAMRWLSLRLLESTGKITRLERQVPIVVTYDHIKLFTYKADFAYFENGRRIFEDVKSPTTAKLPVYRLKKKLLWAILKIEIKEVI